MISQSTIQKIIDYAKIEDVVGDFVRLKKSGVNYKGLCPFHNEKTPSFMVNPVKNIFKCFGCGESGNPVSFVMKHEQFTYPEALRYIAEKYAITIEEDTSSQESKEDIEEKESLFNLNAFAQKYFSDMLLNSESGKAIAYTYLENRGFKTKDIEKFLIGYNPDVWDAFTQYAIDAGYSLSVLDKSGLTIFKDTNKCYDRFKGRIIFPIQNLTGRIVGFGGRLIGKDEKRPKYVNSPETDIYSKSKVLYGLFQAKSKIVFYDNCYLVEGYTDVIAMHKANIENVVASSGTSLTKEQISLIKRYTQNITILFDGDTAGIKASLRGIDMILEEGMNVKIVSFPEGEDPDSFTQNNTNESVRHYIQENAADFIKYKTSLLLEETKNDPIKKAGLIKEIVGTISLIPDAIIRSLYIQECSILLDINENILHNHLSKELRSKRQKKLGIPPLPQEEEPLNRSEKQIPLPTDEAKDDEESLIRFLLNYANEEITFIKPESSEKPKEHINEDDKISISIAHYFVSEITNDGLKFDTKVFQDIFDEIAMFVAKDEVINNSYFINHPDESLKNAVINVSFSQFELSHNWEDKHQIIISPESSRLHHFAIWFLNNFKSRKLFDLLKENANKLKDTTDPDEQEQLMKRQMELMTIKKMLGKKMGRIFLK